MVAWRARPGTKDDALNEAGRCLSARLQFDECAQRIDAIPKSVGIVAKWRGAAFGSRDCLVARLPGIRLIKGLQRFLDHPMFFRPHGPPPPDAHALIGWGLKRGAFKMRAAARRYGLPCIALEDGFLRSVTPGDVEPGLSVSIDNLGAYDDARAVAT
jgi:hypothetical protein